MVNHKGVVYKFIECLRCLDNNIDWYADPLQVAIEFHCEVPAVFNPPLDDADIIVALVCLRPF